MKKLFRILLALLMAISIIPSFAGTVRAETLINSVSFAYDTKAVGLNTNLTGSQVTEMFRLALDEESLTEGVRFDTYCSYLAKKTLSEGEDHYDSLRESDELLNTTDEYYFIVNLEDKEGDGYDWNKDALPSVTVNGEAPYLVRWYSEEKESVDVIFRAYISNNDYVSALEITPHSQKLQTGTNFQFSAEVSGSVSTVSWQIVSETSSSNTYVTDSGRLYVGADEMVGSLILKATSTFNSRISDQIVLDIIDEPVVITSVTISPKNPTVKAGDSFAFTADVEGTDYHDVIWTLTGANSPQTKMSNRYLEIDRNETASTLTVRATSVRNSGKWDETTVTVIPAEYIYQLAIVYDESSVVINTSVTGQSVTEQFRQSFDDDCLEGKAYFDKNCSYLAKRRDVDGTTYFDQLDYSDELLSESEDYYLIFNLEDNKTYRWDPNQLPEVTVNGRNADIVRWYSEECSSVNVMIHVNLDESAVFHTISFDSNGGSGTMYPQHVAEGKNFSIPDCAFTPPEGYRFDHWFTNDFTVNDLYLGDTIVPTKDMLLKAIWTEKVWSAEFEPLVLKPIQEGYAYYEAPWAIIHVLNTGTEDLNTNSSSIYLEDNVNFYIKFAAVDPLVKPGEYMEYISLFLENDLPDGVYTDTLCFQDAEGKIDTIRMDIRAVVYDTDECLITFDNQGIGEAIEPLVVEKDITFKQAKKLYNWPWPTAEGYVFEDWYYDAECTSFTYGDETVDGDMTLYASWHRLLDKFNMTLDPLPNQGDLSTGFTGVTIADSHIAVDQADWVVDNSGSWSVFTGNFRKGDDYYLRIKLSSTNPDYWFDYNANTDYVNVSQLTLNGVNYADKATFEYFSDWQHLTIILPFNFGVEYVFKEWIWAADYSKATAYFRAADDSAPVQSVADSNPAVTVVKAEDCENNRIVKYHAHVVFEGNNYETDSGNVELANTRLGHNYGPWQFDSASRSHYRVCSRDGSHKETQPCTFVDTVSGNVITHECSVCHGKYTEEIPAGKKTTRLFGQDRYETSFVIADQLKEQLGVSKFANVVIACATNYADALAGSYLAAAKNAPIILAGETTKKIKTLVNYLKANVASGATVYVLGGEAAVSANVFKALTDAGLKVERVWGDDRYKTNIEILNKAGISSSQEILVCSALNYADSLSAAATGRPILLVKNSLTKKQKEFLTAMGAKKFCLIGGTDAVSTEVENQLKAYGAVRRKAGETRYETSKVVAETFFSGPETAVVAYGMSFPDGLCAGPLAYAMKAPILLATSSATKFARNYVKSQSLKEGYVIGGTTVLSDAAVRKIYDLSETDPIIAIKY